MALAISGVDPRGPVQRVEPVKGGDDNDVVAPERLDDVRAQLLIATPEDGPSSPGVAGLNDDAGWRAEPVGRSGLTEAPGRPRSATFRRPLSPKHAARTRTRPAEPKPRCYPSMSAVFWPTPASSRWVVTGRMPPRASRPCGSATAMRLPRSSRCVTGSPVSALADASAELPRRPGSISPNTYPGPVPTHPDTPSSYPEAPVVAPGAPTGT